MMGLNAGARLGPYEVVASIGAGGMGEVYRARDTKLDGRFITYQSDREGDAAVYRQLADGSALAERLTKPEVGGRHEPESWSPDGKALTINVFRRGNSGVWLLPVDPPGTPQALVDSEAIEKHSTFSPDGR